MCGVTTLHMAYLAALHMACPCAGPGQHWLPPGLTGVGRCMPWLPLVLVGVPSHGLRSRRIFAVSQPAWAHAACDAPPPIRLPRPPLASSIGVVSPSIVSLYRDCREPLLSLSRVLAPGLAGGNGLGSRLGVGVSLVGQPASWDSARRPVPRPTVFPLDGIFPAKPKGSIR